MSPENTSSLEDSLMDLHHSVNRLIKVMQAHAGSIKSGGDVLDKLPILDFYNDELLRNIHHMRERD
jgi:hypothetical protein